MAGAPVQPIIIIKKKKGGHGGHHGGAWKVAYADFVTAMMALFIVLWLLSSSEQVQKAVGGYFTDPHGKGKDVGNGLRGVGGESLSLAKAEMGKLKEKIEKAIQDVSAFKKIKENVRITVTGEGLRVELVEGKESTFFESGSPKPTEFGREILAVLAGEVGRLPNKVTLEGHTDAKPFPGNEYSNWELSSDRANAARRWMMQSGLRSDQVTQVRGFADQSLRVPTAPEDPSNRRVTLLILYAPAASTAPKEEGESKGKEGEAKGKEPEKGKEADSKPGKPEAAKAEAHKPEPFPTAAAKTEAAKPGETTAPTEEKPPIADAKPESKPAEKKSSSWIPKFVADRLPGHSAPAPEPAKK